MPTDNFEQTAQAIATQAKIAAPSNDDAIYLKELVRANGDAAKRAITIDADSQSAVAKIRTDLNAVVQDIKNGADNNSMTAEAIGWHEARSMLQGADSPGERAKAFELVRANPDAAMLAQVGVEAPTNNMIRAMIQNDLNAAGIVLAKNAPASTPLATPTSPAATPSSPAANAPDKTPHL